MRSASSWAERRMIAAVLFLGVGAVSLSFSPLLLALSTIMMGIILFVAQRCDAYMRVIIALLAGTHALLALLIAAFKAGLVPETLQNYIPPSSMAIGASVFALLILAISYIPVIATITRITERYFASETQSHLRIPFMGSFNVKEGTIGKVLFGLLIGINLFQVALNVRLNFFSRDLFNALADKKADDFWFQLLWVFIPLATVAVSVAIIEIVLQYGLRIRWRETLNRDYLGQWLNKGSHYHLQLQNGADNPDQRIADDLRGFVDQTYQLTIGILSQAATLVSFIVILWGLSQDFTLPGTSIVVPGLLVWFAIVYAILGTWLTHLIGRPLIKLNFDQEKVEADYRFSLARLREYSEQVALLKGENAEKAQLTRRFGFVIDNFLAIADRQKKLIGFTASFFQASVVVPYIVAAPYYFLGKITLGQLQQTAGAFSRVDGALTYFIAAYSSLANYKAVIDRLTSFEASLSRAGHHKGVTFDTAQGDKIALKNLQLALPNQHILAQIKDLSLDKGVSVLLTGPSGCGKSTLFRTLAGIWPHASGEITIPAGTALMMLPQKPYIPMGTLRAALAYPALDKAYDEALLKEALATVNLSHLHGHLDEEALWGQTLSLGEQQRVALARAFLSQPQWLFLDEATSALDEPMEANMYQALKQYLPQTTLISIGHRSTLHAFHERHMAMQKSEAGHFIMV
jgi:vitamin B12/bleomycin/antimicrobial peptide transport system ATP-binding/permease protein